jgi:hypothetical protein
MLSRVAGRFAVLTVFAAGMAACSPTPPSCTAPVAPPTVDGSSATEQQMTAAHDAVVKFQKESDTYQTCLVTAIAQHRSNPPFFSRFYDDGFESGLEEKKHQNQLDKERVVGEFNSGVRVYNEMHP